MTPNERTKLRELQRQLVGETQLADKLYSALVHGGFDHIWWAMQDYCQARGKKAKQPPKFKSAKFRRIENDLKLEGWRTINCEPFHPSHEKDEDEQS